MPISNFISGNSIVESMSQGVRDQGYLYALQRQLRAEDQKFVFDQQANPLRLDQLRESLYQSRLENQFNAATMQSRVDRAAAEAVITGNKARFSEFNERAGAISAMQTIALNEQVLESQGYSLTEQREDLRLKYPALAGQYAQQRQNLKDAGGTLAPDQGLAGKIDAASARVERATVPGGVRSFTDLLYGEGSPVAAIAKPPQSREELEDGLGSITRQLEDFDAQGPLYRQHVATFGAEATQRQHMALRAAKDATMVSMTALDRMGGDLQRSQNATLTQETENIRLRKENEELRLQLSRSQSGQPAPSVPRAQVPASGTIQPVDPDAALGDIRASSPVGNAEQLFEEAPASPPVDALASQPAPAMVPSASGNPLPAVPKGRPLTKGIVYIDPDRAEPVIDLGEVSIQQDSPAGFNFGDDRDPPTVAGYDDYDGAELPVLKGNASHVFKAMVTQESRGRQTDSKGRPLTSSKGAIGIAQVLPGTAREQAKIMGIPWDERRYKYDADYNLKLGQGYFERMLKMYDGDITLATAAYNAGPGNVNLALRKLGDPRKGRISYGAWVARLPEVKPGLVETRDYVRITHRNAARAQRGR